MPTSPIQLSVVSTVRWLYEGLAEHCEHRPDYVLLNAVMWQPGVGWPEESKADLRVLIFDPNDEGQAALLDALPTAKKAKPTLALVIRHDPLIMKRLLRDHVQGYLTLNQGLEDFGDAIAALLSGEIYVPQRYVKALMGDTPPKKNKLSDREKYLAQLLVSGMSHQAIAKQLHISEKTVSSHKTNILKRLDLNHLPDLVRYHDKHPFEFKIEPVKPSPRRQK